MIKKLFKFFLFIPSILVCSHAFGYDNDADRSGDVIMWLISVMYVVVPIAVSWVVVKLNKEEDPVKESGYRVPPGVIQDNTKEIISAMYDENLGFNFDNFKTHAQEVFKALKNAYAQRDGDKLPFMTEEQYFQHRTNIEKYIREGEIYVTEIENFDKSHLYKYNKTAQYDYLSIFFEIFGAEYIINDKTREIIPGGSDDNQLLRYVLVFRRDRKVLETTVKDAPEALKCPNCGAPAIINNVGRCTYCGAVIKDGSYAWALSGFNAVEPDYHYAPGGVYINDIQTERYKNGIN